MKTFIVLGLIAAALIATHCATLFIEGVQTYPDFAKGLWYNIATESVETVAILVVVVIFAAVGMSRGHGTAETPDERARRRAS